MNNITTEIWLKKFDDDDVWPTWESWEKKHIVTQCTTIYILGRESEIIFHS